MIGFPWTIRIMGFVMLFDTVLILLLGRPRTVRKSSGPFVEWQAFLEPAYSLFAIGIFLILWGIYIAYFYVCQFLQHWVTLTSLVLKLIEANKCFGVLCRRRPTVMI